MRPIVAETTPGVVLLDKEPGRTSFQSLYPIKKLYGNSVGHTGTLDQFAEGLLVVLVGKFTKFNPLFTAFDKVYEADFTFGAETTTLDPEGAVVMTGPVPEMSPGYLAPRWTGELQQVPPQYSAIHVDGKRASDRMRSGESLEMLPRLVTVYSLEVLLWKRPVLTVRIHCSKGTYVRSIARDWGRALGCGAHVTRLRRLRVGPFGLPTTPPWQFLDALETLKALDIPRLVADESALLPLKNGRPPEEFLPGLQEIPGRMVGVVDGQGRVFATLEKRDRWGYLFVDREGGA